MPEELHEVEELLALIHSGAQVVEVLPQNEYEEEHLPGALNVSLKEMTEGAVALLDRSKATVVYCWDDV